MEVRIVKKQKTKRFGRRFEVEGLKATKFAPGCGERAIRKSKSLKTGGVRAFLEVQVCKICTTLRRESDFEVGSKFAFCMASAGISTQRPHKNR